MADITADIPQCHTHCTCSTNINDIIDVVVFARGWFGARLTTDCPDCQTFASTTCFFHYTDTDEDGDYLVEHPTNGRQQCYWILLPELDYIEEHY